jgi:orotate phosphoribosyltransferase
MDATEKQERARLILQDLYRDGFVETIYNTQTKKHATEGWTLKNGSWSPWFLNLRPIGARPRLVSDIAYVMNHMVREEVPGLSQIMGIEMAGVPLVSAIGTASGPGCQLIRYSYTRPMQGEKLRNPDQARERLEKMRIDFGYGGKELVEGRFEDGEHICIVDDMVTDLGSKLIAKCQLEYELKGRGVRDVKVEHVTVVLDREQGGEEEARKHGMNLHSLIKFKTFGLEWLRDAMIPQEHQLITNFQTNPKIYQGPDNELKQRALEEAREFRGAA